MHGPTAAAMRSILAPSEIIAATAWSVTPATAPRQPACSRANYAGFGIGQQHWRAIGRHDS